MDIIDTEIYIKVELVWIKEKVENSGYQSYYPFSTFFHDICILENDIMTEELIRLALISKNITKRFNALLQFKDKQHCLLVSC